MCFKAYQKWLDKNGGEFTTLCGFGEDASLDEFRRRYKESVTCEEIGADECESLRREYGAREMSNWSLSDYAFIKA